MQRHEVRTLLQRSASICSILLLASLSVSAEPTVSPATTKPVVTPVAAVIKPVAFVLCAAEGQGAIEKCGALGGTQTYTVSGNRTLLIEQITGVCAGAAEGDLPPIAQRIAINVVTGGTSVDHAVLGERQNGGFEGFSDDTRLYADAGSTISVDLTGITPGTGGRFCRLSFSGQFVR